MINASNTQTVSPLQACAWQRGPAKAADRESQRTCSTSQGMSCRPRANSSLLVAFSCNGLSSATQLPVSAGLVEIHGP